MYCHRIGFDVVSSFDVNQEIDRCIVEESVLTWYQVLM